MVRERYPDSGSPDASRAEGRQTAADPAALRVAPRHACEVGRVIEGSVSPLKLARLAGLATDADDPAPVRYRIEFLPPGVDKLWLAKIAIEAELRLTCERCLEPMDVPLTGSSTLQFVYSDEQAAQVGAAYEPVIVDDEGMVSVAELIEDEVLITVPVVVRHAEACREPWRESATDAADADTQDAAEKDNPFAVLASLRKGHKDA